MAPLPDDYQELPWPNLAARINADWLPGEHVAIVGPTGVGKTTLLTKILPIRTNVVVFVTKVHDTTIARGFPDYEIRRKWSKRDTARKILLWPKPGKTIRETIASQKAVFQKALDEIFQDQNWTVVFDEQHYMATELGLGKEQTMYFHQGRSSGLTVVAGTQRPAWVPVVTYSATTHAFIWKTTYDEDRKRLADLGGVDKKQLEYNMLKLGKHDFIYVNTRNGLTVRSRVK